MRYFLQSGNYRDIVMADDPLKAVIKSLTDADRASPNQILTSEIIINTKDFEILDLSTKIMPLGKRFYKQGIIEIFDIIGINPVDICPIPSYTLDMIKK